MSEERGRTKKEKERGREGEEERWLCGAWGGEVVRGERQRKGEERVARKE